MKLKQLLLSFLLAIPFVASATDYYFSDCQSGITHDASCVVGSDTTGSGTASNPYQTTTKLPFNLAPGDRVFFASGGSWAYSAPWYFPLNSGGDYTNPIIVTSYTASWCAGGCVTTLPFLKFTTLNSAGIRLTASVPTHREGINFIGLKLAGTYDSTTDISGGDGFFFYQDIDWVTLDSMDISGFHTGMYFAGASGTPIPPSNSINEHYIIKNSLIHDNIGMGILGGADDVLIENNTITDNGSANIFDHNIYLAGGSTRPMDRLIVRGNYLSGAARKASNPDDPKLPCDGVEMNFHGVDTDVVIENNTIDDTGLSPTGGCYGISLTPAASDSVHRNLAIRGNKIINVGSFGIDVDNCEICTIENNLVVWSDTNVGTQRGINLPDVTNEVITNTAVTIRNNSIYLTAGSNISAGIRVEMYGTGYRVLSNLVVYDSSTPNSGHACYIQQDISYFTVWDYNLCYDASGNYKYSRTYQPTNADKYLTLATAQAAGFDVHGSQANPLLVATPASGNSYSMAVGSGSPVINAGHPTLSSRLAFQGRVPSGARDIGAFDYGSGAPVTASPTGIKSP
jgi:hypothetical protein